MEPFGNLFHPGRSIVGGATKFNYYIQLVIFPATSAETSVCFKGFFDKIVKKFIEYVFTISRNDELSSPLGKLTKMLFLAQALFHLDPPRCSIFE